VTGGWTEPWACEVESRDFIITGWKFVIPIGSVTPHVGGHEIIHFSGYAEFFKEIGIRARLKEEIVSGNVLRSR